MPQELTFEELTAEPQEVSFEDLQEPVSPPKITLSPYERADIAAMEAGRGKAVTGMESGTELTTALARDLSLGEGLFRPISYAGNIARAIPADVAETIYGNEPYWELHNLASAALGDQVLPIDEQLREASRDSKTWATVGKISQGLAATAPMLGISALPAAAQKLALAGFTAQMLANTPEIASQLGEEVGKPKEQQDPDKISTLVSEAIQNVGFTVAGGLGVKRAFKPEVAEPFVARTAPEPPVSRLPGLPPVRMPGMGVAQVAPAPAAPLVLPPAAERPQPAVVAPPEGYQLTMPRGARPGEIPFRPPPEIRDVGVPVAAPVPEAAPIPSGPAIPSPGGTPLSTENLTAAAYKDPQTGEVHTGRNHPEILKRLGITGFSTRESRNVPEFGFQTSQRPFVSRQEATDVGWKSGQNLADFDEGHLLHSDETSSPVQPGLPLGDTPKTVPDALSGKTVVAPARTDFSQAAIPALETRIGQLHNLLINSGSFGASEFYDRSFPIPKEGGIVAAKHTERYRADPAYADKVDAAIQDITDTMVRANRQKLALVDRPDPGAFGVDYSVAKARATYGVNVVRAWHNEAKNVYDTPLLGNISIRESLQNSVDAVLAALQLGQIKKGSIKFDITRYQKRGFRVQDNGIGMSDTDIGDKFLSLHSSGKAAPGRFGGFGIAKAVILGPADSGTWRLHTRDNSFTHELASANEHVQAAPFRQGTEIEVKTPDIILDHVAKQYVETTELPKNISLEYDDAPVASPFRRLRGDRQEIKVSDKTSYDVTYYPRAPEGYNQKMVIRLVDERTGAKLTQAVRDVGGEGFKGSLVVDIKTKTVPGSAEYPLVDSRMYMKWDAERPIQRIIEKHTIDPLSAAKAGETSRRMRMTARSEWRTTVARVPSDPGYIRVANTINAIWEETGKFFGSSPTRPFTPLTDLELKIVRGYKGYSGGTMFNAKHLAAYEAVSRLLQKDSGAKVGEFYALLDPTTNAEHAAGGAMGFNFVNVDKTALKNPYTYALYLRDLVTHELTHDFFGPHNEQFTSKLAEVQNQTSHLLPQILRIAEAVLQQDIGQRVIEKRVAVPVETIKFVDRYLSPKQQEFIYGIEQTRAGRGKDDLYYPAGPEFSKQLELGARRAGERPLGLGGEAKDIAARGVAEQPSPPSVAGSEPGGMGAGGVVLPEGTLEARIAAPITGVSEVQVRDWLRNTHGITPENEAVGVFNDPSPQAPKGRFRYHEKTQRPIGIELNSAKIQDMADLKRVMDEETAHWFDLENPDISGQLRDAIRPEEWARIQRQIEALGYEPGKHARERTAAAITTLADAWRGRGWFDGLVEKVVRFMRSTVGMDITRLELRRQAERVAVAALAEARNRIRGIPRETVVGERVGEMAALGKPRANEVSRILAMSPDEVIRWKRDSLYNAQLMRDIASQVRPDQMGALVRERDRLRAQSTALSATREVPNIERALRVSLKAQTLNELIENAPRGVGVMESLTPKEDRIISDVTDAATAKPWNLGYSIVMPEVEAQFYFPNKAHAQRAINAVRHGETIETLGDLVSELGKKYGKDIPTGQRGFKAYYRQPSEFEAAQPVGIEAKNPMVVREPYGYSFDEADLMSYIKTAIRQGHDALIIVNESALPKGVLEKLDEMYNDPAYGHSEVLDDKVENLILNNLKKVDWQNGEHTLITFDRSSEVETTFPADIKAMTPDQALDLYNAGKITKQRLEDILRTSKGGVLEARAPGTPEPISELSDRLKATAPTGTRERLTARERIADAWAQGKTISQRAQAGAIAIGETIKDTMRGVRSPTELDRKVAELDFLLQRSAGQSREAGRVMARQIKDVNLRRAAALWIDTPGDAATKQNTFRQALRALPPDTPPAIRRAIETAADMPPEGIAFADHLREYFETRERDAVEHGLFGEMDKAGNIIKGGLDDYFTHIWGKESNMPDDLRAAISNGRVNTYWQFARHRTLGMFLDGIMAGKVPELDPGKVIPYYNYTLDRSIASRSFIKQIADNVTASDGRAAVAPTGTVSKVGPGAPAAPDATLVRPRGKTDAIADYRAIDHPAMRKWKWLVNDENGNPILSMNDLVVHPEFYDRIARFMDRGRLTPTRWGRRLLRASTEVKGFKLGLLSAFHQVHVGSHALFHWTLPFRFKDPAYFTADGHINWDSPQVRHAVEKGHLKLAPDPNELNVFAEGLLSPGLIHKLPIVGPWSRAYSEFVFADLIPKLKLKTFANALPRNERWYAGKLTPEEIAARVGDSVNNAYGELNALFLGKMGRSPQFQRILRGIFLAPDFGEARLRFVTKAATKFGGEERLALATMFATLYLGARVGNWLTHGDPEADSLKRAFAVKVGKHWFSMRSVIGDLVHAMTEPGKFMYVRLNPLYSRTAADWLFGRDLNGRKLTPMQKLVTRPLQQLVPIQMGGLTRDDQKLWESAVTAMGLQTVSDSPQQDMYEAARKWAGSQPDPKIRREFERREQSVFAPSDYIKLRFALNHDDAQGAQQAYEELLATGHKPGDIYKAMHRDAPFSGSQANEWKFKASLNPVQRKLYDQAKRDRRQLFERFLKLKRTASAPAPVSDSLTIEQ